MKVLMRIVLDRSGSMDGKQGDVIGGVNTFLQEQQAIPDPAKIAMTRFDDHIETFRTLTDLKETALLTPSEYQPRGSTRLLDAIGNSLVEMEAEWAQNQPDRAIMVINTDGAENASNEYTFEMVKSMIQSREKSGKWSFIFLGAGIDAFAHGGALGLSAASISGVEHTNRGIEKSYMAASAGVSHMRNTGALHSHNLGRNIADTEDDAVTRGMPGHQPTAAPAMVPPKPIVPTAAPVAPVWQAPATQSKPDDVWQPPAAV